MGTIGDGVKLTLGVESWIAGFEVDAGDAGVGVGEHA